MKTMQTIYARFAQIVLEEGTDMKFREICASLGVSPVSFDEFLIDELGMTGEEYMASLDK